MNIILGANGHVGAATAKALLNKNESVTVLLHSSETEEEWKRLGAAVAIADINDVNALRQVYRTGKKVFLLNPPAAPSADTVAVETRSVNAMVEALENSGIKKIVAESTYGAQPGEGIGDLGVLYEMEQSLTRLKIPTTIIRAAYYMSNWDMSLETARKDGVVHTLYPADFKIPMVSPDDIGNYAALFLSQDNENTGLRYVEGPEEYSANDVAAAYTAALDKTVTVVETPKHQWLQALQTMGFSKPAAESMAAMTDITLKGQGSKPATPYRGITSLKEYIKKQVSRS